MLSHKLHKIIASSMALALVGTPIALVGCRGEQPDVPTAEDIDKAAIEDGGNGTSDGGSAGGGTVAPAPQGSSEAEYDEDGNLIVPTDSDGSASGSVQTSADGNYSTADFVEGSAIYGKQTATITNGFSFNADGIGTWEMIALKDENGYVYAGDEIKPTTLRMGANNLGTISTDGKESAFGWQQYKDFPQLALGDIGKQMTLTMELNDDGKLTIRQDADGQVMLFQKSGGAETVADMAPVEQPAAETAPVEGAPVATPDDGGFQTFG